MRIRKCCIDYYLLCKTCRLLGLRQTKGNTAFFMPGKCGMTFQLMWINQLDKFTEGKCTLGTTTKVTFWLRNFLSHKSPKGEKCSEEELLYLYCAPVFLSRHQLLPLGSWGRLLSYMVQLFSCTGVHKSTVLPLGEVTAFVELVTLWEMSVILTFWEKHHFLCHMSQWELETRFPTNIFFLIFALQQ